MIPSAEELVERKRIAGLDGDDVRRICELGARLKPASREIAGAFFEHLLQFDAAKPLLGQQELYLEAFELKRRHVEAMFDGEHGAEYVAQCVRLGTLYGHAGLPTRLFLGAYPFMLQRIAALARDPERFASVRKLAFFDIGLIVDVLADAREQVIVMQQEAIRELSTPVLQVKERLLLVPVVGMIDPVRARNLAENVLHAIRRTRARAVVIDVTGVANVDARVAHHLFQTVAAARLMGARTIVSGLSGEVSQALAAVGLDARVMETAGALQTALEEAERWISGGRRAVLRSLAG